MTPCVVHFEKKKELRVRMSWKTRLTILNTVFYVVKVCSGHYCLEGWYHCHSEGRSQCGLPLLFWRSLPWRLVPLSRCSDRRM